MTDREWMPVDYIDEVSPPWRASPDAWIDEVKDGVAVLGPVEDEDGHRLKVKLGDVVKFSWQELVTTRIVRVWDDHHVIDGEDIDSDSFTRVCTTYGDGGFLAGTFAEFVDVVREAGEDMLAKQTGDHDEEWPIEVLAFFYLDDVTEGDDFRLIDKGGALGFVPASHVS